MILLKMLVVPTELSLNDGVLPDRAKNNFSRLAAGGGESWVVIRL
jgi:hypothetical protein